MTTAEQFVAANKTNVETLLTLANTAFASAERIAALNLNTARAVLEDTVASTKALLAVKDVQELVALQSTLAQPLVEKTVAYSRSIYEIASQTQEEVSKVFEAQVAEANKTFAAALDKAAKSAPAGSDVAVAAVKSAIAAANSAYDSVTKAAKQVAEIAEANVAAATSATVKAVLPDSLLGFAKETVEIMGIEAADIIVAGDEVLAFDDLHFMDTIYFGEIPQIFKDAVDYLKANALKGQPAPSVDQSVYISRRDAVSRPLINNAELEARLLQSGFDIVATGELTLRAQIALFANAKIVVGQHGAGLINAIFCEPGSVLIELFPEYMLQAHFWTAASLVGVRYGFVSGTSFDADSSIVSVDGNWDSVSVIDVERVVDVCRRLA